MIRFGDFDLDETRRELRRGDAVVAIQPKVLDLLAFLIRHRDRVVSQAEVLRALWPDAVVTPASLARALKEARRALGDDGTQQRWIRTHRGGGYRFVGEVEREADGADADAAGSDYVGRAALLATLDTALGRASAGAAEVVLLVGPAGIGKTRTATELARQAERRGARVEWVRCAGAEYAPPLWPWRRLLAALGGGRDLDAPPAATPADRFRLLQEAGSTIEHAAARGPLVLMFDDLHEADAGTAALLSFLALELRDAPVLLCATFRRDELERRPELARERARLLRRDGVVEHELAPLDAAELGRFVEQRIGAAPPPSAVSVLLGATQGNPLWIQEVVRGGLAGDDGVDVDWQRLVARGFEQVLRDRLARFAPELRRVLEAAAVLGEEFDAEALAAVAKCEVEEALAEARREGLLLASEPDLARHRFSHTVFREALLASTTDAARADLHARCARALESRDDERHVEAIARHWLAAGARGDPVRAVAWAQRAGLRALAVEGWAPAARLFERAVALAEREGVASPETRCDLLLRLAEARSRIGELDGTRVAAERSAALAQEHGWPTRRAEAALLWAGPPFQYRRPDREVSQRLEGALVGLVGADLALAARLLARRAAEHVLDADASCAAVLRRQAVDAALSCGDAEVLAQVLMTPYSGIWEHVDPARRLGLADACIERAQAQGNPIAEGRGRLLRIGELLGLGDFERFDAEVDAAESLTVEHHEPTGRYQVLLHRTTRALAGCDLARAERTAEQALALGRRAEIAGAFELFGATLTVVRREQGRLAEISALQPSLFAGHPSPAARVLELWGLAEFGELARARELLTGVLADTLPTLAAQPTGIANAALLARASFLLGERAAAEPLAALLAPYAERVVLRGTLTAHGPASYFLALLAWMLGRQEEVGAAFEHARAFCRRMGAPGWGAQVDFDSAQWQAERGDVRAAHELATRAARAARALGMLALAPQAQALADGTSGGRVGEPPR